LDVPPGGPWSSPSRNFPRFFAIRRERALNDLMMEQTEVLAGTGSDAPVMSPKLALSDEVRASLEAVRVAQQAARVRARRQTVRTRIWFATSVAAAALVAFAFGPRVARSRHAGPQAATAARPSPTFLPPPPPPSAPAPAPAVAPAPAPARAAAAAPETTASAAPAVAAEPAIARAAAELDPACDTTLIRSAPWRLSPEACARALAADPNNAGLALAVAQAAHARGHLAEAAQSARRALALDPKAAEAYVIIARAEAASGRHDEARAAYVRYLVLAPRGWHRAEARAAVQR